MSAAMVERCLEMVNKERKKGLGGEKEGGG